MAVELRGTAIVAGSAEGVILQSDEPLSFWGGYDPGTGEIIDRRHPLSGRNAAGCVLVLPFTRGSSTGTAIMLEAIRAGKAPVAIVSTRTDPFLALSVVVAEELYDAHIPVMVVSPDDMQRFADASRARIEPDGSIRLT